MMQDSIIVPDDHFIYKNMNNISTISRPLFEDVGIIFLAHYGFQGLDRNPLNLEDYGYKSH